jgi:hypothetical protein
MATRPAGDGARQRHPADARPRGGPSGCRGPVAVHRARHRRRPPPADTDGGRLPRCRPHPPPRGVRAERRLRPAHRRSGAPPVAHLAALPADPHRRRALRPADPLRAVRAPRGVDGGGGRHDRDGGECRGQAAHPGADRDRPAPDRPPPRPLDGVPALRRRHGRDPLVRGRHRSGPPRPPGDPVGAVRHDRRAARRRARAPRRVRTDPGRVAAGEPPRCPGRRAGDDVGPHRRAARRRGPRRRAPAARPDAPRARLARRGRDPVRPPPARSSRLASRDGSCRWAGSGTPRCCATHCNGAGSAHGGQLARCRRSASHVGRAPSRVGGGCRIAPGGRRRRPGAAAPPSPARARGRALARRRDGRDRARGRRRWAASRHGVGLGRAPRGGRAVDRRPGARRPGLRVGLGALHRGPPPDPGRAAGARRRASRGGGRRPGAGGSPLGAGDPGGRPRGAADAGARPPRRRRAPSGTGRVGLGGGRGRFGG